MKKRIAALIISMLMLVSLLPVTAFADQDVTYYDLFVCGTQVTSDNCGDVLGDGKVYYDPDTKALRLADGAALTAPEGKSCIDADGTDLTVVAEGVCALTATGECSAIDVRSGSLTMTGGSWTVSADKGHVIYAEGAFEETEGRHTYLSGGDVTITDCTDVLLSVDQGGDGENVYYDALYADGAIELKNCPSFKIVSYDEGISVGYGGMIVDNCGLSIEIKGGGIGIYDAWSYDYDCKTGLTPDVIIRNCPKLNVQVKESHAIYVGGVWGEDEQHRGADYDTFYAGTGNLRISNCSDVVIDNGDCADHAAIFVCGGVSFTDCTSVRLNSGYEGIYAGSNEVLIDGCDFTVEGIGEDFIYGIECDDSDVTEGCDFNPSIVIRNCPVVEFDVPNGAAMYSGGIWVSGGEDEYDEYVSGGTITVSGCGSFLVNGIRGVCSMGDMRFTDCPDVEINVDHYGLFNGFGTMEINNCDAKLTSERSCICAGEEMRIVSSTVSACSGDAGNETYEDHDGAAPPDADVILVCGDLSVHNSSVTARAGKGEEAYGIYTGSMEVTGSSVINAYGGTVNDDDYFSAVYFDKSLTLDGRDVTLNLVGGNPDLPEDDPDYYRVALESSWLPDEAETGLIVKNGATLNADASLLIYCDVTIDGGTVNVSTPTRQALWCGDCDDEGDQYYGTVTVKNGGKLIANTQSKDHSAVYANGGINVDNSTLFASSAGIAAVGCPQPGKIIFGKDMAVGGSSKQLGYTERDMAGSAVTESYNAEFEEYALFAGDDPALTVYATVQEPSVPDDDPTDPTDPTEPTDPTDPSSPETGDTRNLGLWFALLIISSMGVVVSIKADKKEKE